MQTRASEGFASEATENCLHCPADDAQSAWAWWRSLMPISHEWAYFDHAAVAPISHRAAEAMRRVIGESEQLGDTVWPRWAANLDALRGQAAELLNGEGSDFYIVPNTSTGISLVAEGYPWEPGDEIVVPEGEFPSNYFPWLNQEHRGVRVVVVPRRKTIVSVDDLMKSVNERTRLISVSWVGYSSGFRVALDELVKRAHERGILVFLDAIQGLGIHPLDLRETPVDFLAADGHKWLLGPEGVGVAMITARHREKMRVPIVGWSSVKSAHDFSHAEFRLRDDAACFEPGSANMVGVAGLSASLSLFLEVQRLYGRRAIEDRVLELADRLAKRVRDAGALLDRSNDRCHQSGIVTFQIPGMEPNAFRNRALESQVAVSCRGGGVRASVHAYNNDDDIDRLVGVLQSTLSK